MTNAVKGRDFPSDTVVDKCAKAYSIISKKKKKIDMDATGEKNNNLLLDFLQCQAKATKSCKNEEKEYTRCHQSFMGVGSYNGRKHCGLELEQLYTCLGGKE